MKNNSSCTDLDELSLNVLLLVQMYSRVIEVFSVRYRCGTITYLTNKIIIFYNEWRKRISNGRIENVTLYID